MQDNKPSTQTTPRASTVNELLESLEQSLGDWLGIDGHYYTVAELRLAIETEYANAKAAD